MTHLTDEIRRGLQCARIPTPGEQDRLEVRLLTLYMMLSFINDLVGPITYVFQLSPSLLYKVAALSHVPQLVGGLFCVALALALPHAIALLCYPKFLAARLPRKLATVAAVVVAVTWAYLAVLAIPLDAGPLPWLYGRQAVEAVALGFLLGISLNSQQVRTLAARQAAECEAARAEVAR